MIPNSFSRLSSLISKSRAIVPRVYIIVHSCANHISNVKYLSNDLTNNWPNRTLLQGCVSTYFSHQQKRPKHKKRGAKVANIYSYIYTTLVTLYSYIYIYIYHPIHANLQLSYSLSKFAPSPSACMHVQNILQPACILVCFRKLRMKMMIMAMTKKLKNLDLNSLQVI